MPKCKMYIYCKNSVKFILLFHQASTFSSNIIIQLASSPFICVSLSRKILECSPKSKYYYYAKLITPWEVTMKYDSSKINVNAMYCKEKKKIPIFFLLFSFIETTSTAHLPILRSPSLNYRVKGTVSFCMLKPRDWVVKVCEDKVYVHRSV